MRELYLKQTPDELAALREKFQNKRLTSEQLKAAQERWANVQKQIADRCESGKMLTFGRPLDGGGLQPIPPGWWNTERLVPRFRYCQISPKNPFGDAVAGHGFWWIFVDAAYLSSLGDGAKLGTTAVAHPSRTRARRPPSKVPDILAALRELWPQREPDAIDRKAICREIVKKLGREISLTSLDRARDLLRKERSV